MILTVTPNPMLEKQLWVGSLRLGEVHRAHRAETVAGGKGVNVSRAVRCLGLGTLATGFFGGEAGFEHLRRLAAEGIEADPVHIAGATRVGLTVVEEGTGRATGFYEPGPAVSRAEADALVELVRRRAAESRWVALCGSLPAPGLEDLYARLVRAARERGARTLVDGRGEPLRQALLERPDAVHCNREEAAETLGRRLDEDHAACREAVEAIQARGAEMVVLTGGAAPVLAAFGAERFRVVPPSVPAVFPVGSGDAFVAALLAKLVAGAPAEEALRFAVAAGSANAGTFAVARIDPLEVAGLMPRVAVQKIA